MNKSLFAVLLVCAFAGLAYAAPYNDEMEEQDETQQAIQLLKALQSLQEMEDEQVNVQQQQGGGRNTAKSQWFRAALGAAHHLLGRK